MRLQLTCENFATNLQHIANMRMRAKVRTMTEIALQQHSEKPQIVYKGYLLLVAAIWGLATVCIKSLVDFFPPAWLISVRFIGAGSILAVVLFPKIRHSINADHLKAGAKLSVFLFLGYWLNALGLTDTTASNSAFLMSMYCVCTPFLLWFISGTKPTVFNIGAALMCVAGVGCISLAGSTGFSLRFGDVVTLVGAVFLSLHVIYSSRLSTGRDVMALTVIQFLFAGCIAVVLAVFTNPLPVLTGFGTDDLVSLVFLVVCSTCCTLLLQNIAVAHVHPSTASLLLATLSAFGCLFGILLLGDPMTLILFAGFALIFAGIVVSEYLPQKLAEMRKA